MPLSDYPADLMFIGYYIQEQDAGSVFDRSAFSQDLFDMYDVEIVAASARVTRPIALTPAVRATMALIAANAQGGIVEQAHAAVAAYVTFRGV